MLARVCLELGNLRRVAGQAWVSYVTTKSDLFRLVRVFVALEAATEFVVSLAFVALAAERNDLSICWRVTIMTVLTGYLCFMSPAFGFNISWRLYMALGTVCTGEGNCWFCGSRCGSYRFSGCDCRCYRFGCKCYRSEQKQG